MHHKIKFMSKKILLASLGILFFGLQTVIAQNSTDTAKVENTKKGKSLGTLTVGGYGEAVYKYNFFSDNVFRYSHADNYADSKGHGRVDLPHAVIMLGYDFGHGWTFNTEIEFEHGGTESAVEVEAEETGEFEKEIERGGEVAPAPLRCRSLGYCRSDRPTSPRLRGNRFAYPGR